MTKQRKKIRFNAFFMFIETQLRAVYVSSKKYLKQVQRRTIQFTFRLQNKIQRTLQQKSMMRQKKAKKQYI